MDHKKGTQVEETIEGKYANYFNVGYNADVFVLDYYQIFPGDMQDTAKEKSVSNPKCRIITSPSDAKHLLRHLEFTISEYEKAHGTIQEGNLNQ